MEFFNLLKQGKLTEALEVSKKLLASRAEMHNYYNHAVLAYELNKLEEATWALQEAKKLLPGCPIIRRILSDFLLQLGQYQEGFAEKEWRFTFPLPDSPRPGIPLWGEILPRIRQRYKNPYWDGLDISGSTILVFNEAGFGDMIQNIRYLPYLKAKKVIVEVKEDLYRLFKNSFPYVEVYEAEGKVDSFVSTFVTNSRHKALLPPHDYVVSSESFLHFFDSNLHKIEPMVQYIKPKITDCKAAQRVRECNKKIKVGICWAGNDKEETDCFRSCKLKHFRILEHPNVQLFSLQKGKMKRKWQDGTKLIDVDLLEGSYGMDFIDLAEDLGDFNDTAEAILELDLVITVDTVIAHLAGAMGKPVWLLRSQRKHDWRWNKQWYSSMVVIDQKKLNDWEDLMRDIAKYFCTLVDSRRFCGIIELARVEN
jgi:hypothetical protein